MGEYSEIDKWLRSNIPQVHIVKVKAPRRAIITNYLDQKLGFSWAFVFSLRLWHAEAYRVARCIHDEEEASQRCLLIIVRRLTCSEGTGRGRKAQADIFPACATLKLCLKAVIPRC